MNKFLAIAEQFSMLGKIADINPLGSGHIHDTYRIRTESEVTDDYVLQQLNTHVFQNPSAVTHNLEKITSHIHKKLILNGISNTKRSVLTPVKLKNGKLMHIDAQGSVWRCFIYIPQHKTYDRAVSADQVYEGGKAYGRFLYFLADLPSGEISETIPGFHDLNLRINQFEDACRNGVAERISETRHEIDWLIARKGEMRTISDLGKLGIIPQRIVHHDTKINNVLFDNEDKGLCVIDLDTVMPGYVHDDFGDSIRTFTNTGEEDDADLSKVSMNILYFEAFARGFLEFMNPLLNQVEKDHLALSARVMTYMQVLRFLSDYLKGDTYYKIHYPLHNLHRARAQIRLLISMEEQYGMMKRIIDGMSHI